MWTSQGRVVYKEEGGSLWRRWPRYQITGVETGLGRNFAETAKTSATLDSGDKDGIDPVHMVFSRSDVLVGATIHCQRIQYHSVTQVYSRVLASAERSTAADASSTFVWRSRH